MFSNNTRTLLPIILGSVFTSLFAIFGLSVDVYAEEEPEYVLGNLTLKGNLTAAQAIEASDKIANYTNTMFEKSKGNLTKLNMLLIDDLLGRKIISEKDKQELVSFTTDLNKITPTGNLTIAGGNVSSLIEDFASNSSNPILITIKETLKKKTGPVPGIPGLPPLTIGGTFIEPTKFGVGCAMVGTAAYGLAGLVIALQVCDKIL
jgi:hypothetical protein